MRSLKTYIEIYRKKGFCMCLREVEKAVGAMLGKQQWVEEKQSARTARQLLRKYGEFISKPLRTDETNRTVGQEKVIWICWLQGRENAPEMVKQCTRSVEKWMPDYEIRFITAENMWDYVTMPKWVKEKYERGTISFTHLSDILRTCLLVEHGGIWLDSTVLLTGRLPEYVTNSKLFVYQKAKQSRVRHHGSNWLIAAEKGEPVLERMRELLFAYWKKENGLSDYFFYHVFLYLLKTKNEGARSTFEHMEYVDNIAVHQMQRHLFSEYSDELWQEITNNSNVHKLTWKFRHGEPTDKKGTIYDYILHCMHL